MARFQQGTLDVVLSGVADPQANTDAANRNYVDTHASGVPEWNASSAYAVGDIVRVSTGLNQGLYQVKNAIAASSSGANPQPNSVGIGTPDWLPFVDWIAGVSAPTDAIGSFGSYYLDSSANAIYGPKLNGVYALTPTDNTTRQRFDSLELMYFPRRRRCSYRSCAWSKRHFQPS